MTRVAFKGQFAEEAATILRCPACAAPRLSLSAGGGGLVCGGCGAAYGYDRGSGTAQLTQPASRAEKAALRTFWGDICRQWYDANDLALDTETLKRQLLEVERFMVKRRHLVVTEMKLDRLAGRRVLEIGCGGGAHAALFKLNGADVTAVDITPERVLSTARKLALIPEGKGAVYEADAEHLPFIDDAFDFVYSNGVLHHSPDTRRALDEVWRVLKPGGTAVIMLYSRHSAYYWLNLLPRAIVNGTLFRMQEAEFLGRITEGKPRFAAQRNPITRVYSRAALGRAFARYEGFAARKGGFLWNQLPIPRAPRLRETVLRWLGHRPSEAGVILYGMPMIADTSVELWLGRHAGFDWNITARKPASENG